MQTRCSLRRQPLQISQLPTILTTISSPRQRCQPRMPSRSRSSLSCADSARANRASILTARWRRTKGLVSTHRPRRWTGMRITVVPTRPVDFMRELPVTPHSFRQVPWEAAIRPDPMCIPASRLHGHTPHQFARIKTLGVARMSPTNRGRFLANARKLPLALNPFPTHGCFPAEPLLHPLEPQPPPHISLLLALRRIRRHIPAHLPPFVISKPFLLPHILLLQRTLHGQVWSRHFANAHAPTQPQRWILLRNSRPSRLCALNSTREKNLRNENGQNRSARQKKKPNVGNKKRKLEGGSKVMLLSPRKRH